MKKMALVVTDSSANHVAVGQRCTGQWLSPGGRCSECKRRVPDGLSGIICYRSRSDGTHGGCSKGVCWRCMKPTPNDGVGKIRCYKSEFESLGSKAWWMHEACMSGSDENDFYALMRPPAE